MPPGRLKHFTHPHIFVFSVILIYAALTQNGYGAESRLSSQISLSQTYNDNITNNPYIQMDDYIFMAMPALTWDYQSGKTLTTASAALTYRDYKDTNGLDRTDQLYSLNHQWSATETIGATIEGTYQKENTIDKLYEETGLTFYTGDRDLYHIMPGLYWNISERTSTEIAWGYTDGNYESTDYSDYTNKNGTLSVTHLLSDSNATLILQGSYAHQHYPSYMTTIDQYRCYLGLTYPFRERFTLTAWSGARYTETDYKQRIMELLGYTFSMGMLQPVFQERLESKTEKNWGYIGLLELTHTFDKGKISLQIQQDIDTSTALGETIEEEIILCDFSYRITETVLAKLHTEISKWNNEGESSDVDHMIYRLHPSLNWQLTKNLWFNLSYYYTKINKENTISGNDDSVDNNQIYLGITLSRKDIL